MIADGLQKSTKLYIAALAGLALSLTLASGAGGAGQPGHGLLLALVFAGCMTLAWLFPLHFAFKTKLYVDTAVVVAAVLLFEPSVAMVIAGGGTFLAHALQGSGRDWPQAIFNAALATILAAFGGLVLAAAGWDPGDPSFSDPWPLLAIPVACVLMHILSVVGVATVIALESKQPIVASWREGFLADPRIELLSQVSLFGIGVLAAVVAHAEPWALALLVAPIIAVYAVLKQQNQLRQQAEEARQASEANLATTQRVARIGNWEWDLTTGTQTWSEEAQRILGLAPGAEQPAQEAVFAVVDPADRTAVEQALHACAKEAVPLHIDYRVHLTGGESRLVHQEAKVQADDSGRPVRMTGTIQDVTERKLMEAQIADLSERERIARELAKARRRLAESREEERMSLARTLHDGPVQDLLAVSYQLAALQSVIDGGRTNSGDSPRVVLDRARHELLDVVGQLRGMIGELRPAGLAEFGVAAALEGYVAGLQRQATDELPAIFLDVTPEAEDLPPSLAISVFRIAQEAVRNALKHAGADEVTVFIERSGSDVVLEVHDDGRGFAVPARLNNFSETGHFGLVGIAERVEQAGGAFTLDSASGTGTTIDVRLPLAAAEMSYD